MQRISYAPHTDVSPSAMFSEAETRQQLIVLPATRRRRWRAVNPFSAGPPSSLAAVILIRLTLSSQHRHRESATLGYPWRRIRVRVVT